MAARARRRWSIAAGTVGILALGGWWVLHPQTQDPYPFLAGHAVADVAVLGPGSWPASELRAYSWKQPWQEVAAGARLELPRFGLSEQPKRKNDLECSRWMGAIVDGGPCGKNSDHSVVIASGRSRPLRKSEKLTDGDPEWVTVLVSNYLEESWVNIVRYTFFSMPD